MSALRSFNASLAQGWSIGFSGSLIWNVGCRPVAAATALLTRGWAGSSMTGPGPDGGGMNSAPKAIHPTLPEGEKSGGLAFPAAPQATPAQRSPARAPLA